MAERQKRDFYHGGLVSMNPGMYSVLITPFDNKNQVDMGAFEENLHFQLSKQVDGIVVLGTTAETPTLTKNEQHAIVKCARKLTEGKVPLYVGTGSFSTETAIEYTLFAKDCGANGALVVCPYYSRPTQEGLYQHFKALASETKFPILVYNHPGRTGTNMTTDTLKRLSQIEEIIGVKETSGNILQMMDIIESIKRPGFVMMSGDDILTFPLMAVGGHGVLSVISNLIPEEMKQLTDLMLAGKLEEARALHYEFLPLFKASAIETNPAPIKAMMNYAGMKAGSLRLPLVPLLPENQKKLQQMMDQSWSRVGT